MALCTLQLCITYKWWLKPYLYACTLAAWLTGVEPDIDKIAATVIKGACIDVA